MSESQGCQRCGTCCRQGGPALHSPDLALLHTGQLRREDLITVRRGELAVSPLSACPEPVTHEFLKLQGRDGTWCCVFYDEDSKGCLRYQHRPLACGLLDCRDTGPILDLAGQDLLTRFACLVPEDPLLPLVREHEALCPCPDLAVLRRDLERPGAARQQLAELEIAVAQDLAFRGRVTARLNLSLGLELFAFGRPLFQLLQPLGLAAVGTPAGIRLQLHPPS